MENRGKMTRWKEMFLIPFPECFQNRIYSCIYMRMPFIYYSWQMIWSNRLKYVSVNCGGWFVSPCIYAYFGVQTDDGYIHSHIVSLTHILSLWIVFMTVHLNRIFELSMSRTHTHTVLCYITCKKTHRKCFLTYNKSIGEM